MKIYNLRRGGAKTIRLLCISEYTNAPILCVDQAHKNFIKREAQGLNQKRNYIWRILLSAIPM